MAKFYFSVIGITHSLFDIILDIPEIGIQICGWTILALSHVHDAHGNGFQFGMVDGGVLCVPSDQSGKGRKNFSKIAYSNLSYIDSPLVFQERGLVCLGRMGRWVRVTVADQDEGLLPSLGDDGDELLDPATAHVDYVAISGREKNENITHSRKLISFAFSHAHFSGFPSPLVVHFFPKYSS